ncbi:hypothetical protein ACH3VR_13175 [Microbacterium sp. B2969]|uniref:WD40 repeat protein n=1 Tax=Microbacterium alkaliflavum TaxID=3248839 RepID=A0ABW7QAS7_9MICO
MNPAPLPRRRMRFGATAAIGALLVSGLAVVTPPVTPSATAAVTPPDGSEVFRVSQTDAGSSTQPYLTPDGQRVFFTSTAGDLVLGDTNGVSDVFVSVAAQGGDDPFSGAPALVSLPDDSLAATRADGASSEPVSSSDGRYVAFTSSATNLVAAGGAPGRTSIYVRDTLLGKTFRVQGASEPDGPSYDADLSDSGRYLVFTSDATDLTPGDTNGAPDAFFADLDANGDGILGDLAITRFFGDVAVEGGTTQARISGNGADVVFTAHTDALAGGGTAGNYVYHAPVQSLPSLGSGGSNLVGRNAHNPTIDATGRTFAFIDDSQCDSKPAVIAGTIDGNLYYAALGTILTYRDVGYIADPVLSADGSRVAWTTTVPEYDFTGPAAELATPVVRTQEIAWNDSRMAIDCFGIMHEWQDLAEGTEASVSASARTVAYSAAAPAASTVFALDTHRHEGLSVSSTQGQLITPGFMTSVEIPDIPLTSLRGYASAIANAPIYHLPIYHLPIRRLPIYHLPIYHLLLSDSPIYHLPIYHLPIYHLPIYHLAYPGGWDDVLADTPFAGELIQSVTLDQILTWAQQTLAPGSTATDAERAAATRIQNLTLGDVEVDGSALDSLTLAAYVLGDAPLEEVPLAGDGGPLARWQALVDGQGLGFQVEAGMFLADLDAAGLDIERSGVDAVPLRALPVASTMMKYLDPSDLFLPDTPLGAVDVSTFDESARIALFGRADVSGPLSGYSGAFLPDATVADLAAGAPASVTLGILLMSMLDRESYPWEQIAASSIDPNLAEASTESTGCDDRVRCDRAAQFQYTFDPGPGEPATFAAPTATLTSPAGTAPYLSYISWTGPDQFDGGPNGGTRQVDAERTRVPLPETSGGTVVTIRTYYSATTQPGETHARGELTSGSLSASADLFGDAPLESFDNPAHNLDGDRPASAIPLSPSEIYYEWISPQWRALDDDGKRVHGPAQDEDYYVVDAPPAGKRLVVSTNASDGQISLSLYTKPSDQGSLGVADAGPAPGTAVAEQSGPVGQAAQAGPDAAVPIAGQTLVDQTVVGGDGAAQVEAAPTDAAPGQQMLVRVTSGNHQPSSALYSLRVQYLDETPEVQCTPWAPAQTDDPGVTGFNDDITDTTNTLYLFDAKRYGDTYGAGESDRVRDALVTLTGDGHVGADRVDGAVLSIDTDPDVETARSALDGNPCSMSAREQLASAINRFVGRQLGDHRSQITSIVVVGGDDIIPLAPVAQNTAQFTEVSHADDLRLKQTPAGEPCPPPNGVEDPCETPLSAAARTSHILTDDPYGLAKSYDTLGGHLYVPSVALGRLVETPDQIIATVDRFVASDGIVSADSTLTGGYGAWAELPGEVTQSLAWRSSVNQQFTTPWTATDLESKLFPTDTDAPKVVSVNTHANETQMLPGVPGAESGRFSDNDLFLAAGHEDAASLAGSLIFGIGCHAGNNLPTSYYGAVTDWVDVFSQAAGYVGNTGYGLANNVTTALGERLLSLYSDWLGVSVDGDQVSSGAALTYAKQSYLGGLGLYSGYDEKALMEAVYYGLPMYTFTDPVKTEMPLPEAPDLQVSTSGGITTAALTFQPVYQQQTTTDGGSYYTVDGSAVAVPTAQGILPSIVRVLQPQPGLVPRGVILTSLTTQTQLGTPALAAPTVGVPQQTATAAGSAFPSSYATITHQETPAGPVDLLVITPARVQVSQAGQGSTELFTDFTAEIVYGPDTSTDTTPPVIDAVGVRGTGLEVHASDTSGAIASVIVLVQPQGSDEWQRATVRAVTDDGAPYWVADVPDGPFRWMAQVVDAAGNVATDTSRGHLDVENAAPPTLGDPGPDATVPLGQRLLRGVEVTDAVAGERLTATTTVMDAAGRPVASAPATVEAGSDGTTRALVDQPITSPGSFTVTLSVCRGGACTTRSFAVKTPAVNEAPAATVALTSDTNPTEPTSVLTAHATGTDPDGDPVAVAYAWMRNGIAIPGQAAAALDLDGIAQTGDVIRVTVTPNDGKTDGHAASDEVVVGDEVVPPAAPTITATATTSGGAYADGAWSTSAVTVAFACTSGAPLLQPCPAPQTVGTDTSAAGVPVTGTITDLLGRTATASVLVRVDTTAPDLKPVVTPPNVEVGGTATATPNATDASSGVASQSCDDPMTATAGTASVECRATDVAGNSATALAYYTVAEPIPTPTPTPPPGPTPSPTTPAAPPSTPTTRPASPAPRTGTGGGSTGGGSTGGSVLPLLPGLPLPDRQPLGPLAADGSSVFAHGSGVPIIFRAYADDGTAIGTKGYVAGVVLLSSQAMPASTKATEAYFLPFGFVYADAADLWLGSIPTADLDGGRRYTYRVDLADGTSFTVTFGVSG